MILIFQVDSSTEDVLEALSRFQHLQDFEFRPVPASERMLNGKLVHGGTFWYAMARSWTNKRDFVFAIFAILPTLESFVCHLSGYEPKRVHETGSKPKRLLEQELYRKEPPSQRFSSKYCWLSADSRYQVGRYRW
jgi:hypothetical protein